MMTFWVLAAGLTGLALLFILPPALQKKDGEQTELDEDKINLTLFKQQMEELDADLAAGNLDQEQFEASRRDLEKELLVDIESTSPDKPASENSGRWAAAALGVAVPVLAVGMYWYIGDQSAIDRVQSGAAIAHAQPGDKELPPMEVLITRLAERMEQNPENVEGWVMLGRSYLSMGEVRKALNAYYKAKDLAPDEPDIILGYAEALAKVNGGLTGEPAQWIESALELAPSNPNGLWMMGLVEYQRENFDKALELWRRLEAVLPSNGEDVQALRGIMAEARDKAGLPAQTTAPVVAAAESKAAPAATPTAAAGKVIQVSVSLSDELKARAAPEDTLFVFARALNGPPMPLAAKRMQVKDLPVTITLDDSTAMMPQMKLSGFDQVLVGARISKSGNAMPQPGDLQGQVSPVSPGQTEQVSLLISEIRN